MPTPIARYNAFQSELPSEIRNISRELTLALTQHANNADATQRSVHVLFCAISSLILTSLSNHSILGIGIASTSDEDCAKHHDGCTEDNAPSEAVVTDQSTSDGRACQPSESDNKC